MKKYRIYILLDKKLSNPQKVVQAAHLSLEAQKKFNMNSHPSIIILAIDFEKLNEHKNYLIKKNINYVSFFEPIFDKETGIATEAIFEDQAKFLQHIPTLKDKDF